MNIEGENEDPIDIDVELEDTPPAAADIVVEQAKPREQAGSVDEELESLKASVASERQRRIAAETRANEAAATAHHARSETQDSNLHLVTNAIGTLNMAQEGLKSNYSAAMQAQDFDAAAEIQIEMASNAAKVQQLEAGKQQLEATPRQAAPQPTVSDPVEAVAANIAAGGAPKSAAWVRDHPEYVHDPRLNRMMLAAHQLAVDGGHPVDSDGYFNAVETTLGLRGTGRGSDPSSEAAQPVQRRSAPAAAPVSRSGTADGSRPTRVTLSAQEREMAQMMGMSDQDYAKNKLALIQENRLGKPH